jgi:hypothetical protein
MFMLPPLPMDPSSPMMARIARREDAPSISDKPNRASPAAMATSEVPPPYIPFFRRLLMHQPGYSASSKIRASRMLYPFS